VLDLNAPLNPTLNPISPAKAGARIEPGAPNELGGAAFRIIPSRSG